MTLNHHQDTLKEITTKIRIETLSTATQDYHLQWYLMTVNQQQLSVIQHQQLSIKIKLNF